VRRPSKSGHNKLVGGETRLSAQLIGIGFRSASPTAPRRMRDYFFSKSTDAEFIQ